MSADPITCTDQTHYFQPSVNGVQPPRCYCGRREVGEMRGVEVLIEGTLTVPTDSRADLLCRAADKLEALDAEAIPAPWGSDGQEVTYVTSGRTVTIGRMAEEDVDLTVALRAVVAPLSRLLRAEADVRGEDFPRRYGRAADVARAILGEEVPW